MSNSVLPPTWGWSSHTILFVFNLFYIYCASVTMFKKVNCPSSCEVRMTIRFMNVRNVHLYKIYHQNCEVHGEYVMNESMVRKWLCHWKSETQKKIWSAIETWITDFTVQSLVPVIFIYFCWPKVWKQWGKGKHPIMVQIAHNQILWRKSIKISAKIR